MANPKLATVLNDDRLRVQMATGAILGDYWLESAAGKLVEPGT